MRPMHRINPLARMSPIQPRNTALAVRIFPHHLIPADAAIPMMHTRGNPTAKSHRWVPGAPMAAAATSSDLQDPASPGAKDDHAPDLPLGQTFNSATRSSTVPCRHLHPSPRSIARCLRRGLCLVTGLTSSQRIPGAVATAAGARVAVGLVVVGVAQNGRARLAVPDSTRGLLGGRVLFEVLRRSGMSRLRWRKMLHIIPRCRDERLYTTDDS